MLDDSGHGFNCLDRHSQGRRSDTRIGKRHLEARAECRCFRSVRGNRCVQIHARDRHGASRKLPESRLRMWVRMRVCICRHHVDLLDCNLCNRCHPRSVRRGVVGVRRPRHNRAKDHQLLSQGNGVATFLTAAAAGRQDHCCRSKHRNHTTKHKQCAKARDGARASLGRLCLLTLSLEQKCDLLVVCGSCAVCDFGVRGRCRSGPRGVVA